MTRSRTVHRCRCCGATYVQWVGRCPGCQAWNSLDLCEDRATAADVKVRGPSAHGRAGRRWLGPQAASGPPTGVGEGPVPLPSVDASRATVCPTGLGELDRVLSGGLVRGSVTLVGGEPGIGKSTMLLQVLLAVAGAGEPVLLASAEESAHQVRRRAERLGPPPPSLLVLAGADVLDVVEAAASLAPVLVVVDSVQALADPSVSGGPGSLAQVRACTEVLVRVAKELAVTVVLVGHLTKEGALAGPRTLEHLVDTVLVLEGDRHHALRLLRASKHRFGPTGELGLFEMTDGGMQNVVDPYRLLLGDRRPGAPGSAVLPAVEGRRALLVELQALTAAVSGSGALPRRSVRGVDASRLALLLAVLEHHAGLSFGRLDVFASAVGGVRVAEPAGDLALALALSSSLTGAPLPPDLVAFGEVGLGGEVRQVPDVHRRLAEAARVGFRHALVPRSCPDGPPGMEVLQVDTVGHAVALATGWGSDAW